VPVTFGHYEVQTQCNVPAPSLLELWGERRETTELGYPGRCWWQPLKTHGPCFGPPVAKNLVYGPGPGSSSPPRFNTYSRGSTHLGTARPTPGFFLPFSSLKPWRWDLGLGLVGTQDSRLETGGTVLKVTWVLGPWQTIRLLWRTQPGTPHGGPGWSKSGSPGVSGWARSAICDGPKLRHGQM